MCEKVDKLVLLALAAENTEEAMSALRHARKLQPKGKLNADQRPDWSKFECDRDALQTDRKIFEEERTAYHRRILQADATKDSKSKAPQDTACCKLAGSLCKFGKVVSYAVLSAIVFGSVAYAMISLGEFKSGNHPGATAQACVDFDQGPDARCAL